MRAFLEPQGVDLLEMDIKRCAAHDLSKSDVWDKIFSELEQSQWDVIVLSPPCSTFSRARHRHAGRGGPVPLRSKLHVWGFPWLSSRHKATAELGNFFIRQCLKAALIQARAARFYFWEHPEDLGVTLSGDFPASIWQLEDMHALVSLGGATWALHQCEYGADTPKPTRFASNLPAFQPLGQHWPEFNEEGRYVGPLQACSHQHHKSRVGWGDGGWRTSGTEAYPPALCDYIAQGCLSASTSSTEDVSRHAQPPCEAFATTLSQGAILPFKCDLFALASLLTLSDTDSAAPGYQGGIFLAGASSVGAQATVRGTCFEFPQTVRIFAQALRHSFPDRVFSSLGVFSNIRTSFHKDSLNAPFENLLLPLSEFQGGDIWMEDPKGSVTRAPQGQPTLGLLLPVSRRPVLLPAHRALHCTEPWQGDRVILVGFTVQHLDALSMQHRALLASLQFLLPAPPGNAKQDLVAAVSDFCLPLSAADSRHLVAEPQTPMEGTHPDVLAEPVPPFCAASSRHQVSGEAPRPDMGLAHAFGATPSCSVLEDSDPEAWPHAERRRKHRQLPATASSLSAKTLDEGRLLLAIQLHAQTGTGRSWSCLG